MAENKIKIRFKEINLQTILLLLVILLFLIIFLHDKWILNKALKPVPQTTRNIQQTPAETPPEPVREEEISRPEKKEIPPAKNFKSYEKERKEGEKNKGTPIG